MDPTPASPGASDRSLWNGYLALAIGANLACLAFKGYLGDLWYWAEWVKQLGEGYARFDGNYPPLFVHWLWFLSRLYRLAGQPVEPNLLLKALTQVPVVLAHVGLLRLCHGYLVRGGAGRATRHAVMAFVAANPALLVDGPLWGQLDLLPAVLACLALHHACEPRRAHLALPLFTLSLLTKFQMIAFAPIFGVLALRLPRRHLVGAALSVVAAGAVLLPFLAVGHGTAELRQAYVDTLGQYPVATLNAANLWILLLRNYAPDTTVLFGAHTGVWTTVFTAKYFGMACFALLSLFVFGHGLVRGRRLAAAAAQAGAAGPTPDEERRYAFLAATICGVGFFAVLPAMHERYLVPAVAVALAHLALKRAGAVVPLGLTLVSALNMLIVVELNGSDVWRGLSWAFCGVLVLGVLDLPTERAASRRLGQAARLLLDARWFTAVVLPASIAALVLVEADRFWVHRLALGPRQHYLGEYPLTAHQTHGTLSFDRSFDHHLLSVGDVRFASGYGTHAPSTLEVQLPPGAVRFSCIPGVDDEVGTTELSLSIEGDGRTLWGPRLYRGDERAERVSVDVQGVRTLTLRAEPLQDDRYDHVDWIEPVVEVGP